MRECRWCAGPIPGSARRDATTCSQRCRQAAWRFAGHVGRAVASSSPRRFAYADPPYPGMSRRYYGDHPDYAGEVDHAALIRRLVDEYPDGWALSTSARSLRDVLVLCPPGARIGAWTKPAPPTRALLSRSAWEPVIFEGGRPSVEPRATTVVDWCHAAPMRAYPGAIVGTKPPAFCAWMFAMLGAQAGDTLDDLFPGSGAVGHAWRVYTSPGAGADTSPAAARYASWGFDLDTLDAPAPT